MIVQKVNEQRADREEKNILLLLLLNGAHIVCVCNVN